MMPFSLVRLQGIESSGAVCGCEVVAVKSYPKLASQALRPGTMRVTCTVEALKLDWSC